MSVEGVPSVGDDFAYTDENGDALGGWVHISRDEFDSAVRDAGGLEKLGIFASLTEPDSEIYTAWGVSGSAVPLVDMRDLREDGVTVEQRCRLFVPRAVHALYAPVLDKLAGELRDARWALAGAGVEAARYREALAFYADRANYEESGRTKPPWGDGETPIEEDGGLIARAALAEPRGESKAERPSTLQGAANANPKEQD